QAALKLGVSHYLEKPFSRESFEAALFDTISHIESSRKKPTVLETLLAISNSRQSGLLTIGDLSPVAFVKASHPPFWQRKRGTSPSFCSQRGKYAAKSCRLFLNREESGYSLPKPGS